MLAVNIAGQRLTPTQRKALVLAVAQGINPRKHNFQAPVLDGLAELGLIALASSKKGRPVWRATDAGRRCVAASGLIFNFLHKRGFPPYTADPSLAMHAEPEAFVNR